MPHEGRAIRGGGADEGDRPVRDAGPLTALRRGYRRRSGGPLPRLACQTARTSTTSSRGT